VKKIDSGKQKRPNILLIVTDQQRYDCIGYAGDGILRTPNLDRLAKRGVIFTNCYTSWALCVPARASLLSGRYAHKIPGIDGNSKSLPEDHFSLAHFLKNNGYDTALIGKMHLKPIHADIGFQKMEMAEHDPTQKGCFVEDEYHIWLKKEGIDDWQEKFQYPTEYPGAPEEYKRNLQAMTFPYEERYHSTSWIAERAIQYLKKRKTKPFFLCVSFLKPHHPFNPPPRFLQMYKVKNIPLPDRSVGELIPKLEAKFFRRIAHGIYDLSNFDAELCRKIIAHYYATITQIDEAVGRILEYIDLNNTVVVFTSDHGDYLGRRNRIFKDPNLPLDDLVRIPLFFSGKGIPPGRLHQGPVEIGDIVPTLLSLCGLKIPEGVDVDGRDLTTCFNHSDCPEPRTVFAIGGEWAMVRQGPWKYMESKKGEKMLFNLSVDPLERKNLLREGNSFSEIVAHLRAELLKLSENFLTLDRMKMGSGLRI